MPTERTLGDDFDQLMDPEGLELESGDPALENAQPGDDVPVSDYDTLTVVQVVKQCRDESEKARQNRDAINKVNYDASHCRQDLSGKVKGQSAEFLPKVPMALEQFASFVKRGLVAFGGYFQVKLTPSQELIGGPLTESGIVKLMRHRLEAPEEIPPGCQDFPTTIEDAVKVGGLGSLCVLKVCGRFVPTRRLSVDLKPMVQAFTDQNGQQFDAVVQQEELSMVEGKVWRLVIELIRPEDYYPDPTGRGLYEIHRTYRDLHEVIEAAESGEYDPEAVAQLAESYHDARVEVEQARETDQQPTEPPNFRKQVELLEFWGTILDSDGNVAHRNVRCTVANNEYLIRTPEPNPYWHQESPFVVAPLLRVPFSVFHKALFDHAVRLNLAMNELFNLILDGGIGSVWGVRQVHESLIANMDDFTDGIPQGATIVAKPEAQQGIPVFIQAPAGQVPPEAMQTYQLLDREFDGASLMSNTSKGQVSRKEVSATATASADQATGAFIDSVVANLEAGLIRKALRLAWLTMLQNCDDWNAEDVVGCIGPQAAQALTQMSPARRYMTYAQGARFKVSGLSSMVAATREFQKVTSALGVIGQSPMLMQPFMQRFSPEKLLMHFLKCLSIDPEDLGATEEEKATLDQRMMQMQMMAQMARGAQGNQQTQGGPNQMPGSPVQQVQAQMNQMQQPPQGL